MIDKKTFMQMFYSLTELLGEEIPRNRAEMYFDLLKEYSAYQLKVAFNTATRTCRFFPKPVELIEMIPQWQSTQKELPEPPCSPETAEKNIGEIKKILLQIKRKMNFCE